MCQWHKCHDDRVTTCKSHINADTVCDVVDEERGEKYITFTAHAMCFDVQYKHILNVCVLLCWIVLLFIIICNGLPLKQ